MRSGSCDDGRGALEGRDTLAVLAIGLGLVPGVVRTGLRVPGGLLGGVLRSAPGLLFFDWTGVGTFPDPLCLLAYKTPASTDTRPSHRPPSVCYRGVTAGSTFPAS